MTGITEAHWRCLDKHCRQLVGPKNRVEIDGEYFHVVKGNDPLLEEARNRAHIAGDKGFWPVGFRLHVCGPVEPVLLRQRLIAPARVSRRTSARSRQRARSAGRDDALASASLSRLGA